MPPSSSGHSISSSKSRPCGSLRPGRLYLYSMPASRSEDRPLTGWVLYDGACGICSRWVPRWGPRLSRLGLAVAPLQSPWVQERTGLSRDVLVTDIRLLQNDGRIISGADVYRYLLRRTWWALPMYLLS